MPISQKLTKTVSDELQNLSIKKRWKINHEGKKVKVVRDAENEYSIYLNGNYISTLTDAEDSTNMVFTLMDS
jgi:hypothetical protein